MGVTGVTLGELGRRVEDLERVTSRLERSTIRLQTVAEMAARSRSHWWAVGVAIVAAVTGAVSTVMATIVH